MNLKEIFLISSLLLNMNTGYAAEDLQHFDDETINELKDKITNILAQAGLRSFSKGDFVFIGNDKVNDSTETEYKNYYINLKQVRWETPKEENAPTRILTEIRIESKKINFWIA